MDEPVSRLRSDADKCRDLASTAITPAARDVLAGLAERYEQTAVVLEKSGTSRPRPRPAFKWPLS